jgi:endonuclease/exonuclease/phosphatase family metal-dependent hydrolase
MEGRDFIIIGGDFNAARRFDTEHPRRAQGHKHTPWFEEVQQRYQLTDAHWYCNKREVATYRKYQDDHIFVSNNLEKKIVKCKVMSGKTLEWLSDHKPVMLELNLKK